MRSSVRLATAMFRPHGVRGLHIFQDYGNKYISTEPFTSPSLRITLTISMLSPQYTVHLATSGGMFAEGEPDASTLISTLNEHGIDAEWVIWDDPNVDWDNADLIAVRSTWDYQDKLTEILSWAARMGTKLLHGERAYVEHEQVVSPRTRAMRYFHSPNRMLYDHRWRDSSYRERHRQQARGQASRRSKWDRRRGRARRHSKLGAVFARSVGHTAFPRERQDRRRVRGLHHWRRGNCTNV